MIIQTKKNEKENIMNNIFFQIITLFTKEYKSLWACKKQLVELIYCVRLSQEKNPLLTFIIPLKIENNLCIFEEGILCVFPLVNS